MNLTRLSNPPHPASFASQSAWTLAVYQWMSDTKAQIEGDSTVNTQPIAPFVVSTYTAVNTMTGTDALSNFVATLVTAMQQAGITSPRSR